MATPPMSRSAPRSPTRTGANRYCARASPSSMSRRKSGWQRRRARPPMLDIPWQFVAILVANGILVGSMYALVALGFVLIYKATDAINFAQGEFVMFAGFLAAATIGLLGLPWWAGVIAAIAGMIVL